MAILSVLSAVAVAAQQLSPEQIAQIQHDQRQAQAAVEKEFGDRPPSELTNEQRAALIHRTQAAGQAVFAKHGVSGKDFATQVLKLDRQRLAAVEEAEASLEEKEQAARDAAEKQRAAGALPADPEIFLGPNDQNPVEVYPGQGPINQDRPNEDGVIETSGETGAAAADSSLGVPREAAAPPPPPKPAAKKKRGRR
ncbi:MAG: hypothetical protein M3Y59_14680 [Myxococcota bacterium]|nr:hypothetical protein [Myxococcota bacterium]